ncbi:hypothetical protein ACFQX7_27610 [Luedemannella flava]
MWANPIDTLLGYLADPDGDVVCEGDGGAARPAGAAGPEDDGHVAGGRRGGYCCPSW